MDASAFADRSLHFVGIGGAGMSGLAMLVRELGATVSGSDRAESAYTERLREHGIEPMIGHAAANLPAGAEVVVSTAIPAENPELSAARAAGARVIHRGELLGELSRLKRTIAVAGTHGKTTTAAMIAHVLRSCGRDPAYAIGGELVGLGRNAAWGEDDWLVAEADESDRSFLELAREVAVVTNVELDHHASYASLSELEATFERFCAPASERIYGPDVQLAGPAVRCGLEGGRSSRPDVCAEGLDLEGGRARFAVDGVGVDLAVAGEHNVLNALAALAASRIAGVELAEAAAALASFAGTARRFQPRGRTSAGARVYDDYAHHPTEVRATLAAAQTLGGARVVACFQPHLYSRTRELASEFGRALALADLVVLVDVYPARERAEDFPGVSGLTIARAAADAGAGRAVWWIPELDTAARRLEGELGPDDVLVTLGAGDVDRVAGALTGDPR